MVDLTKDPVSAWILARLYHEDDHISSREVVRQLCQKSIGFMKSDSDYSSAIIGLKNEGLIHWDSSKNGYMITETGMLSLRRQIVAPIDKFLESDGGEYPAPFHQRFSEHIAAFRTERGV